MTKSISDLAREAGPLISTPFDKWCERFHDLAIAQYRESLLAGVGEAADYQYVFEYVLKEPFYTADQMAAAIAIERDRCAKVCDDLAREVSNGNTIAIEQRKSCAAAIRGQR